MGTNYYVRSACCSTCGRYDEHHICKSLSSFEAKRRWDDDLGVVIECGSWAEWRTFLRSNPVEVWDEYGRRHEVEDFIGQVEALPPESRCRQHGYMVRDYPQEVSDGPQEGMSWLDPDGFSFSARGVLMTPRTGRAET